MAAYNVFLKEVTKDVFTNEGGTAIAILGRETTQPTNPSSTLKASSGVDKALDKAKLTLPGALVTELNEGAKIIALTVWFNAKGAGSSTRWKFGTISPAVSAENTIESSTQRWNSVAFSKAQAEEQTKASLEALELFIEHLTATTVASMEIYVALETEPAPKIIPRVLTAQQAVSRAVMG